MGFPPLNSPGPTSHITGHNFQWKLTFHPPSYHGHGQSRWSPFDILKELCRTRIYPVTWIFHLNISSLIFVLILTESRGREGLGRWRPCSWQLRACGAWRSVPCSLHQSTKCLDQVKYFWRYFTIFFRIFHDICESILGDTSDLWVRKINPTHPDLYR